jgi:hypothetical protein
MESEMPIDKEVINLMEKHNFGFGSSGGGCVWWTRDNGDGTFTAITDLEGLDSPRSLNDPILVGQYPTEGGDDLNDYQEFASLKEYFDQL